VGELSRRWELIRDSRRRVIERNEDRRWLAYCHLTLMPEVQMSRTNDFRILVATDGSIHATRAIIAATQFPWPSSTRVRAVVARRMGKELTRSILLAALDRGTEFVARAAQRRLRRRWPDADVVIVDKTPVDGVLSEAARFAANVIVLGWRGHGLIRRLLMGGVSRGIVREARCAVLVVRRRSVDVRRIAIGVDGSPGARRAVRSWSGYRLLDEAA
jgi:nucleotide-binding universal stress UspA family protein